jgi:hypothetical protein
MRSGESNAGHRPTYLKFPGVDMRRDVELQKFLALPIDSYRSFDVPEEKKTTYRQMIRASEPSPEVKSDWEQRIRGIRAQSRMLGRRPVVYGPPQIAARQRVTSERILNPYNFTAVEAIAGARNKTFAGPMYHPIRVPHMRPAPCDLLKRPYQHNS